MTGSVTRRIVTRAWPRLAVLAGAAVLAASTAMVDMLTGTSWLARLAVAVVLIVVTGVLLRGFTPLSRVSYGPPVVVLAQIVVLLGTCTAFFADHAMFGVLPGPDALTDVGRLFTEAAREIRVGRPPVPATVAMQCLIVSAVGLVAIIVDLLTVDVRMPAVAGLLLLGLYAVPASLSDAMLPWWAFVLGAAGFAALLAADRWRRQLQWRGGAGVTAGGPRLTAGTTVVTAVALVAALVTGASVTSIGTAGTFPGEQQGTHSVNAPLGLNPFTRLQGQLQQPDKAVELFRISGPAAGREYLRAVTLTRYDPVSGWRVGTITSGQPLRGRLRPPPGTPAAGSVSRLRIQPLNWRDNWLPLFATPRRVTGLDPRVWRWDPQLSAAFAHVATEPGSYTEQTRLIEPSAAQLRAAPPGTAGLTDADQYLQLSGVDPRVSALAHRLTDAQPTTFDKARAVWAYLTSGRFRYALHTKPQKLHDPLADFLFHGKQGYCEQFASAMAVLLRVAHIPTRVAVGFTPGTPDGDDTRTVSTQDAHAWVEVYFRGYGWMTFDPTPLTDGRGLTPPYLRPSREGDDSPGPSAGASESATATPSAPAPQTPAPQQGATPPPTAPTRTDRHHWWPPLTQGFTLTAPSGALWTLLGLVVVAAGLTALVLRRRTRGSGTGSGGAVGRSQPTEREAARDPATSGGRHAR